MCALARHLFNNTLGHGAPLPVGEDGGTVSVQLFFRTDDGNVFTPCTPALSSENPTTDLATNEYVTFIWDSAANVGEATVIVRAVPNDGTQDGDPVDSDPFEVANSVNSTFGPGLEEGNDLNDVGGMEEVSFDEEGVAEIELNDGTDDTRENQDEEFLLVIADTGDSGISYTLDEVKDSGEKLE